MLRTLAIPADSTHPPLQNSLRDETGKIEVSLFSNGRVAPDLFRLRLKPNFRSLIGVRTSGVRIFIPWDESNEVNAGTARIQSFS